MPKSYLNSRTRAGVMGDGKRAQVTLYLIVGLIILLSVTLYWMYKNNFQLPDREIDPQFLPVQEYVEACIAGLAQDGLEMQGLQGGYIELPDVITVDPSSYVTQDPLGLAKVPIWDHRRQSRVPSIDAMQEEIRQYINTNLPSCLIDFAPLAQQFSVEAQDDPIIIVLFTDDDVLIEVEYELEVRDLTSERLIFLDRFASTIPVQMKRMHGLAHELLEDARSNFFLENMTLDLFTANPTIPFTDLLFSCGVETWEVDTVKQEMIATLRANIPRVRIKGTPHAPFQRPLAEYEHATSFTLKDIMEGNYPDSSPPDLYEYSHLYWDPQTSFLPYSAKVLYNPDWGFSMKPYPSSAGRMYTQPFPLNKQYLNFLCMNLYHFAYDINYPVVMQLRDIDALYGAGFTYQYAIPVTIKQNRPTREPLTVSPFIGSTIDPGFCDNIGDKKVVVEARGLRDGFYDSTLNKVNISMRCIFLECPLGLTIPGTSVPRLEAFLPDGCGNPAFVAEKAGYITSEAYDDDNDGFVVVDMTALKTFNVETIVNVYEKTSERFLSSKSLPEDMRIAVLMVSPSHSYAGPDEDNNVELALTDEEYQLDAVLFKEDNIIGGWHGTFTVGPAEDATTFVLPVIEYRPRPNNDDQLGDMMQFIRSDNYQEVIPVAIR